MVSNSDLINRIKSSREGERVGAIAVLRDLILIEDRGLHLQEHSSLFRFCVHTLGYSEQEAILRVNAVKMLRSLPEAGTRLEAGSLSLTNAAEMAKQIKKVERLRGRLPVEEKLELLKKIDGATTREAERILARTFPEVQEPAFERTRAIANEMTLIQFAVDAQLASDIDTLMDAFAHTNFERRYDLLFRRLVDMGLQELKRRDTPKPRAHSVASRRRAVWRRAGAQCEHVDPSSRRRCITRHALEIDHIVPLSKGGTDELSNLRLLCDAHNRGRWIHED